MFLVQLFDVNVHVKSFLLLYNLSIERKGRVASYGEGVSLAKICSTQFCFHFVHGKTTAPNFLCNVWRNNWKIWSRLFDIGFFSLIIFRFHNPELKKYSSIPPWSNIYRNPNGRYLFLMRLGQFHFILFLFVLPMWLYWLMLVVLIKINNMLTMCINIFSLGTNIFL